jgi:hypothetical protein
MKNPNIKKPIKTFDSVFTVNRFFDREIYKKGYFNENLASILFCN